MLECSKSNFIDLLKIGFFLWVTTYYAVNFKNCLKDSMNCKSIAMYYIPFIVFYCYFFLFLFILYFRSNTQLTPEQHRG